MSVYIIMALESLRDPIARLSVLPVSLNAAYDSNGLVDYDMRWSATRQYVQNDVVVVENEALGGATSAYILTGATSLLGGDSPDQETAWQWVALAGSKAYPTPPSTMTVVAAMPNISVSAWNKAANVGRK